MGNFVPLTVVGNLTDEVALSFGPTGRAMARFTVAFNPRRYDQATKEWKDGEPSFYQCTAFEQLAEHVAESVTKGDRVIVTGVWRQRHWVDESTKDKRSAWQLTVDEIGPSLKYATATVKKMARSGREDVPPDDDWASASSARPGSF